jgi:hypothetical protein
VGKKNSQAFLLIGHPRWQKQEGLTSEVGFEFLHSPGGKQLASYLKDLESKSHNPAEEMIIESVCDFV